LHINIAIPFLLHVIYILLSGQQPPPTAVTTSTHNRLPRQVLKQRQSKHDAGAAALDECANLSNGTGASRVLAESTREADLDDAIFGKAINIGIVEDGCLG
jgi:hypothetical protein